MVKGLCYLHSPAKVNSGNFSDYQILGLIGKGRFASVYRCRNRSKQLYAMKVIEANMLTSKNRKYLANCEREVGLLKQLDHPNIIKYSDSFFTPEKLCIILELADTGDLQQVIRQCKAHNVYIAEKTIWGYHYQLCSGLQYLHTHRILHRDLKPSNVFVTAGGCLKLGDLGLGRYLDWASVAAFSQVGTPLYMSPEVLRGHGYEFASDVWSLGCILYEISMLDSPFYKEGLPLDKILNAIVRGQVNPFKPGVYSLQLHVMVESMLQIEPTKRPQIEVLAEAAYANSKFNLSPICLSGASNQPNNFSVAVPSRAAEQVECCSEVTNIAGEAIETISDQLDVVERFVGNRLLPENNEIIAPSNFERRTLDFSSSGGASEKKEDRRDSSIEPLKKSLTQIKISPKVRIAKKNMGTNAAAVPENSPLVTQQCYKKLKSGHHKDDIFQDAQQKSYIF